MKPSYTAKHINLLVSVQHEQKLGCEWKRFVCICRWSKFKFACCELYQSSPLTELLYSKKSANYQARLWPVVTWILAKVRSFTWENRWSHAVKVNCNSRLSLVGFSQTETASLFVRTQRKQSTI